MRSRKPDLLGSNLNRGVSGALGHRAAYGTSRIGALRGRRRRSDDDPSVVKGDYGLVFLLLQLRRLSVSIGMPRLDAHQRNFDGVELAAECLDEALSERTPLGVWGARP